jgi:exonuclease I
MKKYQLAHKDIPHQDDCLPFSHFNYEAIKFLEKMGCKESPEWLIQRTECLFEAIYASREKNEIRNENLN